MTLRLITAALFALAALAGIVRPLIWQRRSPAPPWRLALLLLLQPAAAGLLFLTLHPPARTAADGTLSVATRGTSLAAAALAGGRLVALPEAAGGLGGERVPDLATALRHHGDAARLVILGEGLTARDREVARSHTLVFAPPPPRRGLVALDPPPSTAPGDSFTVGGATAGVRGGSAELLDPAGRRVDRVPLGGDGAFALSGTGRAPGTALLAVRLRDAAGRLVEEAPVPLWTRADPSPRLLILAGAPGPEVKYLARWAADAGLAVDQRLAVGLGLSLGAAPPLDSAALRRTDLAVVDERAWLGLPAGGRAALVAAVHDGLGLLLRADCPPSPAARRQWAGLGLTMSGDQAAAAARLPAPPPSAARRGPGTADAPTRLLGAAPAIVTRCLIRFGRDAVPLARDAAGAPLAVWRPLGRGRIGVTAVLDSFALVTAGRADAHAEHWSAITATLARPLDRAAPEAVGPLRAGERTVLCGLADGATLDGAALAIDPATDPRRCAAAWPAAGWRRLASGRTETWLHIAAADALPGVRRAETAAATLALAGRRGSATTRPMTEPGASWPWLLALLAILTLLWWLERRRPSSRAS